jgi:hypothetical protein
MLNIIARPARPPMGLPQPPPQSIIRSTAAAASNRNRAEVFPKRIIFCAACKLLFKVQLISSLTMPQFHGITKLCGGYFLEAKGSVPRMPREFLKAGRASVDT